MFNSLRRLMFRLTRSANDTKLNFAEHSQLCGLVRAASAKPSATPAGLVEHPRRLKDDAGTERSGGTSGDGFPVCRYLGRDQRASALEKVTVIVPYVL